MDADVPDSGYTSRTTYDTTDITSIISPGAEPKLTHYREINEYGAVDDGAGYYSNIDYQSHLSQQLREYLSPKSWI